EVVGASMNGSEAERRIAELSQYFSNAYVCTPIPPAGDDKSKTDPPAPHPAPADPPADPPPAPPVPPEPPAPRGRFLSRFGFSQHAITIKVGDTASAAVYATYSDAPDN